MKYLTYKKTYRCLETREVYDRYSYEKGLVDIQLEGEGEGTKRVLCSNPKRCKKPYKLFGFMYTASRLFDVDTAAGFLNGIGYNVKVTHQKR